MADLIWLELRLADGLRVTISDEEPEGDGEVVSSADEKSWIAWIDLIAVRNISRTT